MRNQKSDIMEEGLPASATQLNIEAFQETPEAKVIELIERTETKLVIAYPSFSNPKKRNLCEYILADHTKDKCNCISNDFHHKRCWHLRYRPVALKLFVKYQHTSKDNNWLEKIELYGGGTVDQIEYYLRSLLFVQDKIWQGDVLDLDLRDENDEPINRKMIGAAFIRLKNQGLIISIGRKPAQYKTRKGGLVNVWSKRTIPNII